MMGATKKTRRKRGRKALLIIGIILLVLMLLAGATYLYIRSAMGSVTVSVGAPDDRTLVTTAHGTLRGYLTDGIYTYHGIAYAQAKERFVPAEAPESWSGIRDAVNYGPASPQAAILGGSANTSDNGSNNCQNLNLWTPALNDGGKRPVMVWLHGGGMSSGSGNDSQYDGAALAKAENVVVVSVNHRLNVYGFLDLSAYGDKYRYSANVGIDDLVLALKWLEENAEAFGGDPKNITVFGQSGGGAKVLALMTSPYAQGHFQKGIVQSGATDTLGPVFTSLEASQYLTEQVLRELNITPDRVEELQTVSNSALQQAATKALAATAIQFQIPQALGNGYAMEWEPVVDGNFLPTNPLVGDSFAEAGFDVPLLIGSNLNEWAVMGGQTHPVTEAVRQEFSTAYPGLGANSAGNTDTLLRRPLLKIMRHKANQGGAPVYAYVFTHGVWPLGSYHGVEIPFIFAHGNDTVLTQTMASAWASFARDGVPSAQGLPLWEPYTVESGATMILDTVSRIAYHHDVELLELLAPGYRYWEQD